LDHGKKEASVKRFGICLLLLASAVVVAVGSAPAYAVDGVVLINQSTSVSGLPGCGSSGFPIVICQPGSYRLSGNLTITGNTDAIDIKADEVTLDLNGFSIIGPVSCDGDPQTPTRSCTGTAGVGVQTNSTSNIAIRNGSIRGMGAGIFAFSSGALIEEIRASKNSSAGIQVINNAVVRRNTVTNNGGDGIVAQASLVSDNIANVNHGNGITAEVGNSVTRNTVFENSGVGITAYDSLVTENSIFGNNSGNLIIFGGLNANNSCGGGAC
jgi:hypothetical protein